MPQWDAEPQVIEARQAIAQRDWPVARDLYLLARQHAPLSPDDEMGLSDAFWWLGQIEESLQAATLAYRGYALEKQTRRAALTAFLIGYIHSMRQEDGLASGWVGRAYRLIGADTDCVEYGYLLYAEFERSLAEGDLNVSLETAQRIQSMGVRFADDALCAIGAVCEGRVLVRQGDVESGMQRFDEAMVAAISDELDPSWTGNIYCTLITACHELGEIGRAAEWTMLTIHWCEGMTGAGPFLGICQAHRSQILQFRGKWEQAEKQARISRDALAGFDLASVAEASYQIGEIQRKRGHLQAAEASYLEAHEFGRDPQPGIALLRLAQGRFADAATAIETALSVTMANPLASAPLLAAQVEIATATDDIDRARRAADTLSEIADCYRSSGLTALAAQAKGQVLLAEERLTEALPVLLRARELWQALLAPYETMAVRCALADLYSRLGDSDAAARERDAAERTMRELGASRIPHWWRGRPPVDRLHRLTEREVDVLTLLASGKSNREIGEVLFISAKTVSRHLENIYGKLGVTSRSAAAVFAVEQNIVAPDRGSFTP